MHYLRSASKSTSDHDILPAAPQRRDGKRRQRIHDYLLLLIPLVFGLITQTANAAAFDMPYFSFGGGVMDANRNDDDDPERGAWSLNIMLPSQRSFGPVIGVMYDEESATAIYGGIYGTYSLGERWHVSGSFGPAAYWEADSKDLGSTLQFRSGIGIHYELYPHSYLGLAIHHLSNGSLYDHNPGTELIGLYLSVPIGLGR